MLGGMTETETPMSGRKAQAARNDEVILAAARAVFVADPGAPIAAVSQRAGVGISALYRRYRSKEELLQTLCGQGLTTYIAAVRAAVEDTGDPWAAFVAYVRRVVDADTHSLTINLAGTFTPTEQLFRLAGRADELNRQLVDKLHAAGVLRPDIEVADLGIIFEQLAAIRVGDERRLAQLRQRYVDLVLDALRTDGERGVLSGPPPTPDELAQRWVA